jgi:aspartate kinase
MKVLKFGGTSLGSASRIKMAADIVRTNTDCIVVCSAMSGMTNSLLQVASLWEEGNNSAAIDGLAEIKNLFDSHCNDLLGNNAAAEKTAPLFDSVNALLAQPYNAGVRSRVPVLGEQVTSQVVQLYLSLTGTGAVLLDATEFIRIDDHSEPNVDDISHRLAGVEAYTGKGTFITQGFICRDHQGNIATLSRGGSDFTATLIGAAIGAQLIEIWTDIDGMHNNDPRHVSGTTPIREISYTEAAELAYFGAKILHPSCVRPAREKNIPICIKNTFQSTAPGTTIQAETPSRGIRAIAAKDDISILRITSGRMFNAYGFLAKVFEVFNKHKTPVDVVTTSEVSVSVTIEDIRNITPLMEELSQFGQVDLETERCIICVVGDVLQNGNIAGIFQLVKSFDVRMVSLGASSNNITFVLPKEQKTAALNALHPVFNKSSELSFTSCSTTGN